MTDQPTTIENLSDDHLLQHVQQLAADERTATAQLIAALTELDGRRLYLAAGCSSLFTYCTQVLRLSEHAAYGRIEAARAARRYPVVLELLANGEITLTSVTLLAAHLTPDNHREVLEQARRKSRREVERLVATLQPGPAAFSWIRRLPVTLPPRPGPEISSNPSSTSVQPNAAAGTTATDRVSAHPGAGPNPDAPVASPSPAGPADSRPVIAPIAAHRYRVQLTISAATHDKLRRAQDLMRHTVSSGDPAEIFDRALTLLVSHLERRKLGATTRRRALRVAVPVSPTRYIPPSVRRAVWARDDGRCAFVGTQGRCTERGFLEFHHVKAFAEGGETSIGNLQLRCRSHNQYEAERLFGEWRHSVRTELLENERALK